MTDKPEPEEIARRYLDLWQEQLEGMAKDPILAESLARTYQTMFRGVATMMAASGMAASGSPFRLLQPQRQREIRRRVEQPGEQSPADSAASCQDRARRALRRPQGAQGRAQDAIADVLLISASTFSRVNRPRRHRRPAAARRLSASWLSASCLRSVRRRRGPNAITPSRYKSPSRAS